MLNLSIQLRDGLCIVVVLSNQNGTAKIRCLWNLARFTRNKLIQIQCEGQRGTTTNRGEVDLFCEGATGQHLKAKDVFKCSAVAANIYPLAGATPL